MKIAQVTVIQNTRPQSLSTTNKFVQAPRLMLNRCRQTNILNSPVYLQRALILRHWWQEHDYLIYNINQWARKCPVVLLLYISLLLIESASKWGLIRIYGRRNRMKLSIAKSIKYSSFTIHLSRCAFVLQSIELGNLFTQSGLLQVRRAQLSEHPLKSFYVESLKWQSS